MRGLRLHKRGGPEAIVLDDDVPVPKVGIGDVLVRVQAAGLTPTELDWPSTWVDHAGADRTPVIPCHEVCGEVVELGYGTSGFAVGDEVFGVTDWYRDGAAAEYVAVEARNLAHKPATCTATEAAALAMPALTAHEALFDHGGLSRGERVLIAGATGGVGAVAMQLAANAGASVVAAGHGDRAQLAKELGADTFVDLDQEGALENLGGVDLVFDLVGSKALDLLVRSRVGERVVSVVESHPGADFFVIESNRPTLEIVARQVDAGELRAVVGDRAPLADGALAFAERRGPGKRVLEVAAS
jgi:NADPH:quinone reductase-like Zn-dependent oxidoreductase